MNDIRGEISRSSCSTQSISIQAATPDCAFVPFKSSNPVSSLSIPEHRIGICATQIITIQNHISSRSNKKIKTHAYRTLACADKEESIGSNRTIKEIDHWARVTMANKRNRYLFLFHFSILWYGVDSIL